MKVKKYVSAIINSIFVLVVLLFILDVFTSFEIKSQIIKSFTYYGLLSLTPLVLIWNIIFLPSRKKKLIGLLLPSISLIGVLIIGPINIVFASSAWKTQTIIYQNAHLHFKKVEFQMQDIGAFGYNKRVVEVTYLTNLFMIVNPIENNIGDRVEWIKVDENVNELNLK